MPLLEHVTSIHFVDDDPCNPDDSGAHVIAIDSADGKSGRLFYVEPPYTEERARGYTCPACSGEGKGGCADGPLPWSTYRRERCACPEACEDADPDGDDAGGTWFCALCRGTGEDPSLRWTVYETSIGPSDGLDDWLDDAEHVEGVVACVDYPGGAEGLRADATSENLLRRLAATQAFASYVGWGEFDSCPIVMTRDALCTFFEGVWKAGRAADDARREARAAGEAARAE